MSRKTWNLIKQSKSFYIHSYRWSGNALFFSVILNMSLGSAIYYNYFSRPEHDFYATNGETPPVMLTAMQAANTRSVALLESDPDNNNDIKVIPQ